MIVHNVKIVENGSETSSKREHKNIYVGCAESDIRYRDMLVKGWLPYYGIVQVKTMMGHPVKETPSRNELNVIGIFMPEKLVKQTLQNVKEYRQSLENKEKKL